MVFQKYRSSIYSQKKGGKVEVNDLGNKVVLVKMRRNYKFGGIKGEFEKIRLFYDGNKIEVKNEMWLGGYFSHHVLVHR